LNGFSHNGPTDSMGSMASIASGQITAKFGGGSMINTQGRGSLHLGKTNGGSSGNKQLMMNQDAQL